MLETRVEESNPMRSTPKYGSDLKELLFELDFQLVVSSDDRQTQHPLIEFGVCEKGRVKLQTRDDLFEIFQQAFAQNQELLTRVSKTIHEGGRLQVLLCLQSVIVSLITGDNYTMGYYTFNSDDVVSEVSFEPTNEGAVT